MTTTSKAYSGLCIAIFSIVANAQQRDAGSSDAAGTDVGERRRSGSLEGVVVTATKRAESVQDVPISITALSADDIDRRGLVSAEDYLRGMPGVNQMTEAIGTSIVIRGIETSPGSQNFSSGTTVATYFGETPTTNTAGLGGGTNADLKLVDIERVEVLRGPQGTAFGNSSLGGAVRTIPIAPRTGKYEAQISAGYSATSGGGGSNDLAEGVVNVPLFGDRAAIRAVGYRYDYSGYYRNVAGSSPAFQSTASAVGAQAFATDDDQVGSSQFTGGRVAALIQASDSFKVTLGYINQKTEVDGQAQSNTEGYDQTIFQVAPQHVVRGQRGGLFDTDIEISNVTMEYSLGAVDLLGTFSYVSSGSIYSRPQGATLAQPYSSLADSEHHERSGEIRATTAFDGPLNFIAGIYAEELEDRANFSYYQYGSPPSLFGITTPYMGDYLDRRDLKQKAAFTEVSWEFLGGLTLTGGARAYDYERIGRVDSTGAFLGNVSRTDTADADGTSFSGKLSYELNEDALIYANWSQGFRLGKPQAGLAPGVCDRNGDGVVDGTSTTIDQTRILESDEVDNREIGAKFTLFEKRLMIAADVYQIEWEGLPFRVTAPTAPTGCGLAYNANAGRARSEGFELELSVYATDAIRVDLGGSLMRAELTKDAPALLPPAFDGDRLPGAPKVNANLAVQYEFTLAGYDALIRGDSIYVGDFYGTLAESAQTRAGGYTKVDAMGRVEIKGFKVDLFVQNLTNADDYTFRGTSNRGDFFGYRLRPRTIGLQLGYNFE